MPGRNSSFAAKKRAVNATRQKTKKRILQQQKKSDHGDIIAAAEFSAGLNKRVSLYAHMKPPIIEGGVGSVHVLGPTAGTGSGVNIVHDCRVYVSSEARLKDFVARLQEVRSSCGSKRSRAKTVIFVKNQKHGERLMSELGYDGKPSEILGKRKTERHKFGSLERVKKFKGVCLLSPGIEDEAREVAVKKFKAGAVHTCVIAGPVNEQWNIRAILPQAATISAVFQFTAPADRDNYIERCSLARQGDHPTMSSFLLKTKEFVEIGSPIIEEFCTPTNVGK